MFRGNYNAIQLHVGENAKSASESMLTVVKDEKEDINSQGRRTRRKQIKNDLSRM